MFRRDHHRAIAAVLEALDAQVLREHRCWFGGGTAMALRYGEYRESVDVDFLVSDIAGFRWLRQALGDVQGLQAITAPGARIEVAREIRADQYGIRTHVRSGAALLKFEIVHEGRIQLDTPGDQDAICGISCLTEVDLAAEKLLANADRWGDRAVYSRDLIDLAMQGLRPPQLRTACEKAEDAYGSAVRASLAKAIKGMRDDPSWAARCLEAMAMTDVSPAQLLQRLVKLERALPVQATD